MLAPRPRGVHPEANDRRYGDRMTGRLIAAGVLAVVGVVWLGQGLGYIGGSMMTNDMRWGIAGVALLTVAGALAWSARRQSS